MKYSCRHTSRISIVLALLLTVSTVVGLAPAADAAPAVALEHTTALAAPTVVGEGCAPNTGVTVVVDFTALADVIEIGCAAGAQPNGFDALRNAGFGVNVGSGSYPGTVCTIDGAPTQGYPYCWTGGGTWSFWKSDGTAAWAYAAAGAAGIGGLPVGSVQGWSWSQGLVNPSAAPRLAVVDLIHRDAPSPGDVAITWTKRELADNHWGLPGFSLGSIDVGLTADALLALAADGRSATPAVRAVTSVVEANTTAFVSFAPDDPTVKFAGAMAKTLLVAAVQGEDVNDFGGWDLEAELRSMMQTSGPDTGRFSDHDPVFNSDSSTGFSQGLAVLGLARTGAGVPSEAVEYLQAQQCPGGGFRVSLGTTGGCVNQSQSDTDATAMAVQALLAAPASTTIDTAMVGAVGWLVAAQEHPSGAFRVNSAAFGANTNSTGLAAQALRSAGEFASADDAGGWISSVQIRPCSSAGAADLGAIAYSGGAYNAATGAGIGDGLRDQWRRATVQAVLAYGMPGFNSIGSDLVVAPYPSSGKGHFCDVAPTHSFSEDITWMVATGVANGYPDGTFRPVAPVSRQANAAFLYRLAGEPAFTPPETPTFTDVPAGQPFYLEIEWMKAEGLTTGYPDDTFRPAGTVQRQAMAAFLYRLAGELPVPPGAPTFSDVPTTHVFHNAISWLASVGVVNGYPDESFQPAAQVSRQATAAFLHRFALLP